MSLISYPPPDSVRSIAVIGTGSVGASWATLFLARGLEVWAYDAGKDAQKKAETFVTSAWPALVALGATANKAPPLANLRFTASAETAAEAAEVIQENISEDPELKCRMLARLDAVADRSKVILSSTGGIPPTRLQTSCSCPERVVVLHPFNPTHLMPLVEVVGGEKTSAEVVAWAMAFARYLGKEPIQLNTEASGHMTNRLQFALVREAISCLLDGIASASDIDKAIRYGLAPRWVLMGSLLTLHLAGGAGGMRGILDHTGPAIEEWWTPRSIPHLDEATKDRLVEAASEVAKGASIEQWIQWRDAHLVDVMKLQASSFARSKHSTT